MSNYKVTPNFSYQIIALLVGVPLMAIILIEGYSIEKILLSIICLIILVIYIKYLSSNGGASLYDIKEFKK